MVLVFSTALSIELHRRSYRTYYTIFTFSALFLPQHFALQKM